MRDVCREIQAVAGTTVQYVSRCYGYRVSLLLTLLLTTCLSPSVSSQTGEYTVKAVYLERFTRFVEWPEEAALEDTTRPFVITVLGEHPFGDILDDVYQDQQIRGRDVEVRYVADIEEISECHLLFVSKENREQLAAVLEKVGSSPILTVGDDEEFAHEGIHISFYVTEGNVRFAINAKAAKATGLTVSHHLLRVAKVVDSEEDK